MKKGSLPFLLLILFITGCIPRQKAEAFFENTSGERVEMERMELHSFRAVVLLYGNEEHTPPEFVFYYLHGQGGNEDSWYSEMGYYDQYFKTTSKNIAVVSLSAGPETMCIPNPTDPQNDYGQRLIQDVIPEIESKLGWKNHQRIIMGFSMGGTSASYLFFNHPDFFNSAILISAGIYPIPFTATDEEINGFLKRNGGNTIREKIKNIVLRKELWTDGAQSVLSIQKRYLTTEDDWNRYNIFQTMRTAPKENSVYISCGKQDALGLYSGNKLMAEKAVSLGYRVRWLKLRGGHGVMDQDSIIKFLQSDVFS